MRGAITAYLCCVIAVATAHPGVGIVMDSKQNVYYTDLTHVWKIEPSGKKTIVVQNVHTHELYIDSSDNLYGEHLWYEGERIDRWGHYVWRLSASGTFEKIIPNTEGFLTNHSFVRDAMGNMYWAHRGESCQYVVRKQANGGVTKVADHCFNNIRWMTASAKGTIYLIDLYDLKKIDAQGCVTNLATGLQARKWTQFFVNDQHNVYGLTIDRNEMVYVAILGGRKVVKVTPDGVVTSVLETGPLWSPSGVLCADNGDLWVLEVSATNQVRVERVSPQGKRIVY